MAKTEPIALERREVIFSMYLTDRNETIEKIRFRLEMEKVNDQKVIFKNKPALCGLWDWN
jgi:hypothetical protein